LRGQSWKLVGDRRRMVWRRLSAQERAHEGLGTVKKPKEAGDPKAGGE